MHHDPDGRVVPPRCEECNAPLTSDEHLLNSTFTRSYCLECRLALKPFPRKRPHQRRRHASQLAEIDRSVSTPDVTAGGLVAGGRAAL